MSENLRISLVEDDDIIRNSIESMLNESDGFECIGSYNSCEKAVKAIPDQAPDIVLMDIELPGMTGIEGTRKLKKMLPDLDILVVSVHDNNDLVFEALCAGACGYLTKNIDHEYLLESIREVKRGGAPMSTNIARMVVGSFQKNPVTPLTNRETEVLDYLSRGKSYKMIADELFIDKETVRSHIKNIYKKLEVHCKADAIEIALKEKLI